MGDFEDALASATTTTELRFTYGTDGYLDGRIAQLANLEELQLREVPPECELPAELLALPKLRRLGLAGENDKLVVPALVAKLGIEQLDIWDARASDLPPLPRLRALKIVVQDPKAEVAILAERFGHLAHLEIWGSDIERGELPIDIERFGKLEHLELVSCGISALPDAFAKLDNLRTFGIRGCPLTQFPEVLTRMPKLRAVHVAGELAGLPPSLAQMTGLRELSLAHALNKGAMLSRWDDVERMKALPKVLGECTQLEKLVLDCCGVVDLEPLRPLTKLRSLSVSWSAITSLEPLTAMIELEELSLEHCDRVRDLSPLAKLAKLRTLNLDNTRPASLDVLRALPALKELHVEHCEAKRIDALFDIQVDLHADDEVLARYAARTNLAPIGGIIDALGVRDLAIVETACANLAAWAAASSTKGENALVAVLGLTPYVDDQDDDEEEDDDDEDDDDYDDDDDWDDDDDGDEGSIRAGGYLPVLDRALDRYLAQLSSSVLAHLFCALFHETNDNFPAAIRIANELVSRSDDAAQAILVEGFAKANAHYDTGHRAHGYTVHDQLIDSVFPLLGGPALAKLLAWCSDGHLSDAHGDGMVTLFAPALARATGADRDAVLARLETYAADLPPARVDALWAALGTSDVGPIRERIAAQLAEKRRLENLGKRLEDAATAPAALAEAAALADEQLHEVLGNLWSTNGLPGLATDVRRALLRTWQRLDNKLGVADALRAFAKYVPIDELRTDLDILEETGAERGATVRSAIFRGIDRDLESTALDKLRALATELDALPRAVADSSEVQLLLFAGAKHFKQDQFVRGIAALGALPAYTPHDSDDDEPAAFATMVAHLAECAEYEPLQDLARNLHKLNLTGKPLERVLAQLVAVCMVGEDPEGLQAVLPLVPDEVTWDILAFNLACKYARESDRERTLRFTRRALELGKSPDQFLDDTDFEEFADDREFVAILDAHR